MKRVHKKEKWRVKKELKRLVEVPDVKLSELLPDNARKITTG